MADTRRSERRAERGVGVRVSPWPLFIDGEKKMIDCRRGRCPTGSHKAGEPGSIPGSATIEACTANARGRSPVSPACRFRAAHWLSEINKTRDRVRKPAKRSGREPGDFVGSTPTSVTEIRAAKNTGCWSNGKTPGLQPGNRGSTPRRSTLEEGRGIGG